MELLFEHKQYEIWVKEKKKKEKVVEYGVA